MQAWRLCRTPFADMSGDGAGLYGGRWNSPGRAMVYAADTATLAVLEVRVHLDLPPELVPNDYVLATIDLADMPVERLTAFPDDPQAFGDEWLRQQRSPLLQVPSFIVREDTNLLLNPAHPLASGARMVSTRTFAVDRRLWLPL